MTTAQPSQPAFEFYAGPPEPGDSFWLGFTVDHAEDAAAAVFLRRYGQAPACVFPSLGGLLLAGPIPAEVNP